VAVCTVTGHGLKDPQRAIAEVQVGGAIEATAACVAAALDLA
jgi:threonine synthase